MLNYAAPAEGRKSSIDSATSDQMNSFFWLKKSIIETRKEQYFMPLASVTQMPKHFGKSIKVYEYIPLLDDRNINDQGIDAAGVVMDGTKYAVYLPSTTLSFAVEANATAATAAINAVEAGVAVKSGSATPWTVTVSKTTLAQTTDALSATVVAAVPAAKRDLQSGNLYGSSRDIGTISGRMPLLDEFGGRKNRVGFTRVSREGEIHKMGMFYEFTQESLDFDSDDMLREHLARELMNGAVQLTEAVLQKDLLAEAGTIVYAGAATSHANVTGDPAGAIPASEVSYSNLQRLDQTLTDLRCPRQTKVITGSRYIDTKTVSAGRIMYVGSALVNTLRNMRDNFNDKAFIPVQHYADAGTIMNGEIGSVDAFRIIQVPEMLHWAGEGATVGANVGNYRNTNGRYDVYPMLVIGDESFTTIGFQSDGKSLKFNVKTVMPSENHTTNDPYGETGFSSIKWYYGTMILRPERLAIVKTVAKL